MSALNTPSKPIWRALGVQETKHGPRYWIEANGRVRSYRPGEMCGVGFLATIYPYMEHWRRSFPWGVGRRIDTGSALDHFIRACNLAGEYNPDSPAQ